MSRTRRFAAGAGLVFSLHMSMPAHGQEHGARFSSEKHADAEARVYSLASGIAYTFERAQSVWGSMSTNAAGQVVAPGGLLRVYHATAMRKIDQMHILLMTHAELKARHALLLHALESARNLDRLRDTQATGLREDEMGNEYWGERLREVGSKVLPSVVSDRVKKVDATPTKDDSNARDEMP